MSNYVRYRILSLMALAQEMGALSSSQAHERFPEVQQQNCAKYFRRAERMGLMREVLPKTIPITFDITEKGRKLLDERWGDYQDASRPPQTIRVADSMRVNNIFAAGGAHL